MKEIMNVGVEVKISSREIAELTGKRHADVRRDIKKQMEAQEINVSKLALVEYKDKKGEMREEYLLDYEQMMILLTGYSVKLRAKVVKRWIKLEKAKSKRDIARIVGKEMRKTLTDAIKESGENERMHGHAYSSYTNLMYKALGLEKGKRDTYPKEILDIIKKSEELVKSMVSADMEYSDVKSNLINMLQKKTKEVADILEDINEK